MSWRCGLFPSTRLSKLRTDIEKFSVGSKRFLWQCVRRFIRWHGLGSERPAVIRANCSTYDMLHGPNSIVFRSALPSANVNKRIRQPLLVYLQNRNMCRVGYLIIIVWRKSASWILVTPLPSSRRERCRGSSRCTSMCHHYTKIAFRNEGLLRSRNMKSVEKWTRIFTNLNEFRETRLEHVGEMRLLRVQSQGTGIMTSSED